MEGLRFAELTHAWVWWLAYCGMAQVELKARSSPDFSPTALHAFCHMQCFLMYGQVTFLLQMEKAEIKILFSSTSSDLLQGQYQEGQSPRIQPKIAVSNEKARHFDT